VFRVTGHDSDAEASGWGVLGGQRSRCVAHLGACKRGTLVESSLPLLLGPSRTERRGLRGKERAGRRRGVHIHGERGGGKEEGAAGVVFSWACVMEVRASGHVLLCGRPRPSISL
jgi:hypothetical protein